MSTLPDKYLSIHEAANILRVSTKTLRRWESLGKLVPKRTEGGHRRYTRSLIEEYKLSQRAKRSNRNINNGSNGTIHNYNYPKPYIPFREEFVTSSRPSTNAKNTVPVNENIDNDVNIYHPLQINQIKVLKRIIFASAFALFFVLFVGSRITDLTTNQKTQNSIIRTLLGTNEKINAGNEILSNVLATRDSLLTTELDVNVNTNIRGILKLSGNTLTSDNDLNISSGGGGVLIGNGSPSRIDLAGDDLFVSGDFESANNIFAVNSTLSGILSVGGNASVGSLTLNAQTINSLTGAGITIVNGALTSTLGASISSDEIENNTILAIDLNVSNNPSSGQVLTYNASTGGFTWANDQIGGGSLWTDGGSITYLTSTTDDLAIGGTSSSAPFYFNTALGNLTISGGLTSGMVQVDNLTLNGNTISSSSNLTIDSSAGNLILTNFNCSTYSNSGKLTVNSSGIVQCADDQTGGATSPWDLTSGVVHLINGANDVTIGSASNLAKLAVAGNADEVQFLIRGNSTQTSNIITVENSSSSPLMTLANTGNLAIEGTLSNISGSILVIDDDLAVNGGDITSTGALTITPGAGNNLNIALSGAGNFAVNTNQLFVNTSTGRVGIGTSSPATGIELHVAGDLQLGLNGTDGTLTLFNELGTTDYTVVFQTSSSQSQNITYTLPPDDGNANYVLTTDGSGVLTWSSVSGVGGMNSFTLSGDTGTDQTINDGNTLEVAGGIGINTVAGATDTITINFDSTEIGSTTWGSGSGFTWTFDAGATDPTLAFASNQITIGGAATLSATSVTTFNCTDCINWDDIADSTTLDAATTIASSIAGISLDLNVSPAGTATSPIAFEITPTFGIDATDQTLIGLNINPNTNSNTDAGDVLYGINIANITGTAASETALRIGSGWDTNLFFNDTTTVIGIADAGSFSFQDSGGNVLATLTDNSNLGDLTITGDLAVNGGDITSTGALTITPGAGNNLNIALSGAGNFAVNTNQLFVNTSTGSVGIGTSSPATGIELHVAGDLQLGLNGTDGTLTLFNELGTTDYTVVFQTSSSQSQNITYTLPPDDGNANYVLTTDGSGVLTWSSVSGVGGMNSFTLSGDTGTDQTINDGNTLEVAGGIGINTVAGATDTITINFDSTEIGSTTWGSGSGFTWTFDAGATDPTLAFASNQITIGGAATLSATSVTTFNCTDCINWDDIADSTTLDAATTIASSIAGISLDLNVSPAGTATSPIAFEITPTFGIDATDQTLIGLNINPNTNSNTDAGDVLYGINIANITGTAASESALRIGTGWDDILNYNGTTVINGSGQVIAGQITGTLFTAASDSSSSTIVQGDTLTIAGGTNGIDTTNTGDTFTINFDSTEVGTTTWGSGSGFTWTFDAGATDPTLAFASNQITIGGAATLSATSVTTFNCTDCIDWDDIADSTTLDAATTIASSIAGISLDLNVSPAGTAASPIAFEITPTFGIDATDQTLIGLNINPNTNSNTDAGDVLYGINIANITGTAASETALNIGTGWDTAIITNNGNINAGTGTITAATLNRTGGNLTVSTTTSGDLILTTAGNLVFTGFNCTGSANGGALTANASGVITCSDDDSGGAAVWTETSGVVHLVTSTNNVTIGSSTNLAKLAVDGDTDEIQLLVQGHSTQTANLVVFEQSDGTDVFTLTNAGDLTIAGDLTVSGGDIIGAATTNLLNAATTVNLGSTAVTRTINIGTGTNADTINIGTGGTTADDINIGGLATTTIDLVGATSINASVNAATNINTGTSTGAVSIGNSAAGAIAISTGSNFSVTTTTGLQTFTSSATTGGAFSFIGNSITTSTALDISANALTSGRALRVSSTSTNTTAITDGMLGYFNWAPGSSTTKTGDLFRINIGSNGNVTNIFNITDNGSTLFRVSESVIESAIPHSFTAAGDASFAYDINLTNQTSSTIESSAPLYIIAGESSESNNLTLRTYNSGQIVVDGSLNGRTVVSDTTSTGAGTVTVSGRGVSYYLHDNSGTTNSSYTTTINITGVPSTEGSIVFIRSGCQKGATTGSQTHTCAIQINGSAVSSVATATGTGASTVIENYIAAYVNGAWRVITGTGTSDSADLAEVYKAETDVDAAEVVSLTADSLKVRRATEGDGGRVIGVSSTKPAITIGEEFDLDTRKISVALSGRVPVKIDPNSSPIAMGDFIGASSIPGLARKVNSGYIVGRALEDWTPGSGKDRILIFVNTFYVNDTQFAQTEYENRISALESAVALLETQLALGQESSGSATFTDLTVSKLNVLGDTVLGDTVVNGKLNIGTIQIDNINNSIDAIGVLKVQPLALGNIEFLGGLITFDTNGNIIAKEVTAEKYNVAGASAGTGEIPANGKKVFIETTAITENSLVFITPKRALAFPLAVTEKEPGAGFWVELPAIQTLKTEFDWFIVDKVGAAN